MMGKIKRYVHFGFGLKKFLSKKISLRDAHNFLRRKLHEREESLLSLASSIFREHKSPYREILDSMHCTYHDIKALVDRYGVEKALLELAEGGMHITLDEFKGRKPIIRNGIEIPSKEKDFDNHEIGTGLKTTTGGTTSLASKTVLDFDFLLEEAYDQLLSYENYDLLGKPKVIFFPILPFTPGIKNVLLMSKLQDPLLKWYSQLDKKNVDYSYKYDLLVAYVRTIGGWTGYPLPEPEVVGNSQIGAVAQWIYDHMTSVKQQVCLIGYASSMVGICSYARRHDIDLSGLTVIPTGEPLTTARRNEIKNVGVQIFPVYSATEAGRIAYGCGDPLQADDMHLLRHRIAAINFQAKTSQNRSANALLLTTLSRTTPKVMLNVDLGDNSKIESRACSCLFNELDLTDHISSVRSHDKQFSNVLSCEIDALLPVIEEHLPELFGGSCLDYQLVEDGQKGLIELVVNRNIGTLEESKIRGYFLSTVENVLGNNAPLKFRVKRDAICQTRGGKILSFHRKN